MVEAVQLDFCVPKIWNSRNVELFELIAIGIGGIEDRHALQRSRFEIS
jgi:hypothetical protein